MQKAPSVFQYENYREFLRDFLSYSKTKGRRFSLRYFARVAGFSSHNTLRMVVIGKRNLTDESIAKVALALKLNKEETSFFRNLVLFNQAENSTAKQQYAKEVLRSLTFRKIHPLSEAQYKYFSNWYFVPIRELVELPKFKEDPEWIAAHLKPPIQPSEAKKALKELIELGILKRDAKSGRLQVAQGHVMTPDEVSNSFVAQFHREMLKKAGESIDTVEREKRDISAITMGMSLKTAAKIKEMIQNFRKEVVDVVSKDEGTSAVYQLNFQFFPLAEIPDTEEK